MNTKCVALLIPYLLVVHGLWAQQDRPEELLKFLEPFVGDWYAVADSQLLARNPDIASSVAFKFTWVDPRQKMMTFYEAVRGADVNKAILTSHIAANPRTGVVEFQGFQQQDDFFYQGRYEPIPGEVGFRRIYDVYYPRGTQFRNQADEMKGWKTYRGTCLQVHADTLECTTEQLDYGIWEPYGNGDPFRLVRKKNVTDVPDVYQSIAWLVGEWRSEMSEGRAATMYFDWGENKRMIYFRNAGKMGNPKVWRNESAGVISYDGVQEEIVFMNTYLSERTHLMSEGIYHVGEEGVIHREFTCHYKAGDHLPWSDEARAPTGGKSIEFKQVWTPIDRDSFSGDFFWKKDGRWERPIQEMQDGMRPLWKRVR